MIKPFHTDTSAAASAAATAQRRRRTLQSFLTTWNVITPYPLKSFQQLEEAVKDPTDYFVRKYREQYPLPRGVEGGVKLPAGFGDIQYYARDLGGHSISEFAVDGDIVVLSSNYYRRLVNSAYYFAVTQQQKKRLAYAEKLAKLVAEQKDFADAELAEAGVRFSYPFPWSPVPAGVRFTFIGKEKAIIPDEKWVVGGYRDTASGLLHDAFVKAPPAPYGDFRIARAQDDSIVLLDQGDSVPKGYEVISGHFEFVGKHMKQKEKTLIEKTSEYIKHAIQNA